MVFIDLLAICLVGNVVAKFENLTRSVAPCIQKEIINRLFSFLCLSLSGPIGKPFIWFNWVAEEVEDEKVLTAAFADRIKAFK